MKVLDLLHLHCPYIFFIYVHFILFCLVLFCFILYYFILFISGFFSLPCLHNFLSLSLVIILGTVCE